MKITAIETIRLPDRPNLLLAQVQTDEGLIGPGKTSHGAAAAEAQIHELCPSCNARRMAGSAAHLVAQTPWATSRSTMPAGPWLTGFTTLKCG
jgi:hypothetical protein